MKVHVLLTIVALTGLYILDGPIAQAATRTSLQTGNWNDTDNWSDNTVPVAGDTAIIARDHTITVDDASRAAASVIVQDGGTLDFNTGAAATLTIDDTTTAGFGLKIEPHGEVTLTEGSNGSTLILGNDGVRHVIEGVLRLPDDGSVLQISTDTATSTVIAGSGAIVGEDDAAAIRIKTALTVKMETTIEGQLRIEDISGADGVFVNNGLVDANVSGTITLDDLKIRGSGLFRISHASGEIEFEPDVAATQLGADFHIYNGTLDVQESVITGGHLHWVDGSIVPASGKVFEAN